MGLELRARQIVLLIISFPIFIMALVCDALSYVFDWHERNVEQWIEDVNR